MNIINKSIIFALTTLLIPFSLAAASISINNVTGIWTSVTGGPLLNEAGTGTNFIYWGGTGQSPSSDSSYLFTGAAPPIFPVSLNTPFVLGTWTTHNGIIPTGSAITGATLAVNINLSINGNPFSTTYDYNFLHDETVNISPPCCADLNAILNNTPQTMKYTIGGIPYILTISGFEMNGVPVTSFSIPETQTESAELIGVITAVQAPEPATYLLMSSFIFLFGIAAARKFRLTHERK